jgi:hypothetical protein
VELINLVLKKKSGSLKKKKDYYEQAILSKSVKNFK